MYYYHREFSQKACNWLFSSSDPSHYFPKQAWDLYYHVFKRINKQLHSLATLELQYVAPALVKTQGMELAVPGKFQVLYLLDTCFMLSIYIVCLRLHII